MKTFVLVGDSVFDNIAYVERNATVVDHLRHLLPKPWNPIMAACDGARIAEALQQVAALHVRPDHVAVSAGGNDALQSVDLLFEEVGNVAAALHLMRGLQHSLSEHYTALCHRLADLRCPVSLCTIYNAPVLADTPYDTDRANAAVCAAVSMFNDVIQRMAARFGFRVVELRDLLTEREDFSAVSPIEPSGKGGRKLAQHFSTLCT